MTNQEKPAADTAATQRKKTLFVITPIGGAGSAERKHADWILNAVVIPVFEPRDYEVARADIIADPAMINDAIFSQVTEADLCVADLSFLNPNVFYELGVRHTLLKPVLHIARAGTTLPFDTAQHRTIFFELDDYHSVERLKAELAKQATVVEDPNFRVSNPLTHATGRKSLAESGDTKDQLLADLIAKVDRLERRATQSAPWLPSKPAKFRGFLNAASESISSAHLDPTGAERAARTALSLNATDLEYIAERLNQSDDADDETKEAILKLLASAVLG